MVSVCTGEILEFIFHSNCPIITRLDFTGVLVGIPIRHDTFRSV
jgi:hypothetical protein